jgi:hypothetical protein
VDVEKVEGWVLDLERAWREDQDRTAVYVEPGSTRLVFDIDLPASPTIVGGAQRLPRFRGLSRHSG